MFSPTEIRVIVHRARNLLIKGKNSNDAYATMEFGGEKYATNVVEKSVSPSWHQECQFQLPQGGVLHNANVTISVYNKHHGKLGLQNDDFIGIIKIPLSKFDTTKTKEYRRWYSLEHKNPKKEKKERGEVEVGIKFISKDRPTILPDKKSPKNLRAIKDKLKMRRKSEDEDSGVGCDSNSSSMKRGVSMADLQRTTSSASDSGPKRRLSIFEAGSAASARGLVKLSNKIGLGGHKTKATSVEVLHNPEMQKVPSLSNLQRSGSSGSFLNLNIKKQHVRNRSMPDPSLLALNERNSPRNSVCVNGPHIYVSGSDSGNNSPSASVENLTAIDLKRYDGEGMDQLHASHNQNFSNSKPKDSPGERRKLSPLSIVYKPKSYYRLDVKELCKVSPIPEDPTVTFQQMSKEELMALCVKQHSMLANKNAQIKELEDYIDKLLLKVMVMTPQILDCSKNGAARKIKL